MKISQIGFRIQVLAEPSPKAAALEAVRRAKATYVVLDRLVLIKKVTAFPVIIVSDNS